MKSTHKIIIISIFILSMFITPASFAITPKQIFSASYANESPSEFMRGTLVAIRGKRKKRREYVLYKKSYPNKDLKVLFAIVKPASLQGTAVLMTIINKKKRNYLFLPSTKKLTLLTAKKNSSADQKGILGTDFSPSDINLETANWNLAKRLPDSTVTVKFDGEKFKVPCYVIKYVAPNTPNALYNTRIFYLSKDYGRLILKVRMLKHNKLIKILKVIKINKIGKYYRIPIMVVANIPRRSKTIFKMLVDKFNTLPDSVFSSRSIKRMDYLD